MSHRNGTWRKLLVMVIILALIVPVLAACDDDDDDDKTTAPATPAVSTAPTQRETATTQPPTTATTPATTTPEMKPEGTLRIARSSFGYGSHDPWLADGSELYRLALIYDFLVGSNWEGTDVGTEVSSLSTSWEQSADGLSWTFHLRQGVMFDQGYGELTADDVKFSIERSFWQEGSRNSYIASVGGLIEEIVAVDPYTVKVVTNSIQPHMPYLLSRISVTSTAIYPRKAIEELGDEGFARSPVGSGPYRLVKNDPTYEFVYEAREDYWGGVPRFEKIDLLKVAEPATRLAMVQRGEVDLAEINLDQVNEAEKAGLQTREKNGSINLRLWFNNEWEGALADIRVRQAITYAINCQEIVDTIFEGRAEVTGRLDTYGLGADPLPPYPYDPDRARELLAAAGYGEGDLHLDVISVPRGVLPVTAEILAGYLQKVGIDASIRTMETAAWGGEFMSGKLKDTLSPWTSSNRIFPLTVLNIYLRANVQTSLTDDPEMQVLLDAASQASTVEEYNKQFNLLAQYIYDTFPIIPLATYGEWFAVHPDVELGNWNVGGVAAYNWGFWQLIFPK